MDRKVVNLARMLSSLISCFQLPLSIIKPIEITNAYNSSSTILFLSTLLLALFKEKVCMMMMMIIDNLNNDENEDDVDDRDDYDDHDGGGICDSHYH